jgi:predicted metal-binding membrane protein
LNPLMVSTSPALAATLLIAAGIFQWTRWKNACLAHCRSPLSFLMTDWREGAWGALAMGFKHGTYCTGCCWVLMLLLFVAGVMNVFWIAIISILVLAEKVAPNGSALGKIIGVSLVVWGFLQC